MEEKNLRIKVAIGDFTLEIEGSADKVVEQFSEMKRNGLEKLITHPVKINDQSKLSADQGTIASTQRKGTELGHSTKAIGKFPTLRDVALKQLPGPESEWILIYGFYASDFASKEFTRNDIISKYEETNRKTAVRIKNLSNSLRIAVNKDWINSLNDKDFLLSDGGKTVATEILSRVTSSKTKKTVKRKTKTTNNE